MAYKPKKTGVQTIMAKGFYGSEPEVGTDLTDKGDMIGALNWYNNFYDPESCEVWLEEYLTAQKHSPKDIAAVKRAGTIRQIDVVKCRLLNNECVLDQRSIDNLTNNLKRALHLGRLKTVEMFADRIGPAERNRRKAMEFRSDLDRIYDLVWLGTIKPAQIQFFDTFKKIGMKPAQANVLLPVYSELLTEHLDPEVSRSKLNATARVAFIKELVQSLEAWSKGKEEKKQPKVTKKVTERKIGRKTFRSTRPIATAAGLKFKTVDEDTKIASINPKQILGAQILVIFNAKYKQLAIIRAANAEGLSVKGTTILNVDEKTSEAKRAGRHVNAIKEMQTAPKTKIAKLFKDIKADLIPFRTRTSEDIVLVRAIK